MINLKKLPSQPGCYLFKDSSERIIYVGKAKDLKKRVSSYFKKKDHDPKTLALMSHISDVDFIMTPTEVDALILENNLIKRHLPKYNIDLRDAKRFAYIHLTDEAFPLLEIARKMDLSGQYFGPFTSAEKRDEIILALNKAFHLRTCKHLPKGRMCDRHHFACKGPCILGTSEEAYNKRVYEAIGVLKGRTHEIIQLLTTEMQLRSKNQEFEIAMKMRDQIDALTILNLKQTMQRNKKYDEDILNYIVHEGQVNLLLFNIYKGTLAEKHTYSFDYHEGFFEEFIVQYYSDNPVPKELILPIEIEAGLKEFLEKKREGKVILTLPKQGEKKQLLSLVKKNIELTFQKEALILTAVKESLRLEKIPHTIECFDISHLSGTSVVGSMVAFKDGKADKSNYRRFRIKTVTGIDDFASIKEIVQRRYARLKQEGKSYPDLIIIDGGLGQLHSAQEALNIVGADIPIISIAKRLEEIYLPGLSSPLRLDPKGKALLFIRQVRDEAHRFAIAYNRLLRKKAVRHRT
ncbi:MAG: excinuclease ABC subunit UvrC [Nanoarchaeota archaeon]